jgi:hypothetical protein
MGGFAAAWLTAEGIVAYRALRARPRMVPPGQLLGVTVLFIGLDLLATAVPNARFPVTALAWGLNLAGLTQLLGSTGNAVYGGNIAPASGSDDTSGPNNTGAAPTTTGA